MRALLLSLTLCTTLALVLPCRPAVAAGLPAPAAPAGALAPGMLVRTAAPALPAGVREFELLLLPESGPVVRLSRELPVGTREVAWRVPRVAAGSVRLAWRYGGAHFEGESARSARLAIVGVSLSALEFARFVAGRDVAEVSTRTGALTGAFAPTESRIELLRECFEVAEPGSAPSVLPAPPVARPADVPLCGARPCAATFLAVARTPEFTPLRN